MKSKVDICKFKDLSVFSLFTEKVFSEVSVINFTVISDDNIQICSKLPDIFSLLSSWFSGYVIQYCDDSYCKLTFVTRVRVIDFCKKFVKVLACKQCSLV